MTCPNCGERLEGDGCSTVLHCPYAEAESDASWWYAEPFYCDLTTDCSADS